MPGPEDEEAPPPTSTTKQESQEIVPVDDDGRPNSDLDGCMGHSNTPMNCECGEGLCSAALNPVVFVGSLMIIWGFIIWAAADPLGANARTGIWDGWIGEHFSWLYVGAINIFLFLSIYLAVSKYGDVVLGKEGEEPDYSYASWFAMLFSAGIGIGLFFYGTGEPVFHYAYPNRYSHEFMTHCTNVNSSSSCFTPESRVQRALWSMNISWYHWGFGASCCYVIVGLPIALYHYKYDQPLTMRTALYPMLGSRVNGWFGDMVEIAAVVGTVYGVCTSLGLGVTQIAGGLRRVDNDIEANLSTKLWIIWVITAIATVSVVTGLDVGIRKISELNFILGIFILGMIFFFSEWMYLLDFGLSEWGFHINYMMSLSFASDGVIRVVPMNPNDIELATGQFDWATDGSDVNSWMTAWTIFYWGWWISWSPFVGLFIARISRGRTIREFILGNMFVPTILTSVWLLIFGGTGLYYQFKAEDAGMTCDDCNAIDGYASAKVGCMLLSCRGWDSDRMLYDMIEQFPMKDFFTIVTTIGITLYFVTSSDSASAVIDQIASNGKKEGPIWQRVFWAVTEGLTATVVLASAGDDAKASTKGLKALRSISIISAFPFCLIMLMMGFSFLRFLQISENPQLNIETRKKADFRINIFDSCFRTVCNTLSLGMFGMMGKTGDGLVQTTLALLATPFLQLQNVQILGGSVITWGLALIVPVVGLWTFGIMAAADVDGAIALFGVSWMAFFSVGLALRMQIREKLNISGTFFGDLCTWMWCGPFAAYQEWMAMNKSATKPWGQGVGKKMEKAQPSGVYQDGDL